jgi:excisionase family DNA binding protein
MGTIAIESQAGEPERGIRLLTVPEAARRLGLGDAKTWDMVADGRLESVKIDASRRVPDVAVDRFIAKLRADAEAQRSGRVAS